MDYGTPDTRVLFGGRTAQSVASVEVVTDRSAPVGRAIIELDRDSLPSPLPAAGDPVTVELGFRGARLARVFEGRVRAPEPGRLLQMTCHDRMRDLGAVLVREALRNVDLQEIVRRLLSHADAGTAYVLSSAPTARRHLFVADNQSVLALVERARQSWGVPWDLYARTDGTVVFAPWAETAEALAEPVLDLVYGHNLLEFTPRPAGTGTAECPLAPWVRAGHRVTITDSRLWKAAVTARVERCTHQVTASGGGRTRVEWTPLAS